MESSSFDRLTRLIGSSTGRRTALAASAATGLAALTAGTADAQSPRERVKVRLPKGPRGKRGKRGKNGKAGRPGPRAGTGIKVVTTGCSTSIDEASEVGTAHECTASCGAGFVATGGGFDIDPGLLQLANVQQSHPIQDPDDAPVGWSVRIRFVAIGTLDYTAYAICVPS